MKENKETPSELKSLILRETKIINELASMIEGLSGQEDSKEKEMIESQIHDLKYKLRRTMDDVSGILADMSITKPLAGKELYDFKKEKEERKWLSKEIAQKPKVKSIVDQKELERELELERKTIKRIKKNRRVYEKKKERKPSKYVGFSNKFFSDTSRSLLKNKLFMSLKTDMIKSNLDITPSSYISIMLMSSVIAFFFGVFLLIFFMFFNIGVEFPIITMVKTGMMSRLANIFWIPIVAPLLVFLGMFVYPAIEKSHIEGRINQELPFATIHMSAISGSMVEPSKMFEILVATKDYPYLEKEFIKLLNQINVYGYDFVTALRNVATNSPSSRLAELLNGLATTINSGGDLPNFFDKRANSLLFEYRIEREKYTKTAETFMDIYISLVIAAPMILMLLLIMMRVSGLGISLSTSAITLLMILGVSTINFVFLVFLQLKQPQT